MRVDFTTEGRVLSNGEVGVPLPIFTDAQGAGNIRRLSVEDYGHYWEVAYDMEAGPDVRILRKYILKLATYERDLALAYETS